MPTALHHASGSQPKQLPACRPVPICRCIPFLVTLCFLALLALSGCGDLVLNKANTGSLLPQPSTVNFGAVSIGQRARSTVSLENASATPVEITQLNLTGQSFSMVSPSSLPITLAAGGSYSFTVQFNPAAAGRATGELVVASNASPAQTAAISLAGTGTTGSSSAALSALSCSSAAITGSGTDACTLTLTTSAPSGGLLVNLSSSSSAVAVPNTVTVTSGAISAGFTATVSSVATTQAVTMTAGAVGTLTSFTVQLNAAVLAFSINATSVAFGEVMVDTPATQPLTLTSTGTAPVTINGAILTGASFIMPGAVFPATLSPGQQEMLNVEFDPTAVGAATGQLTITSNSSINGVEVIGLSGTGTTTPVVAVAVTPSSASITPGATQQFGASVTGPSNSAVTWIVSGAGCSGAACGNISSSGLYTAPATTPSPATVTITATSVADSSESASAAVTLLSSPGTTYYLAPASDGGNDSNNGLSSQTPWRTPNHPVNCGDVIIAESSSSYNGQDFFGSWGTVTCPTGNNVAWLKCATFDGCKIIENSTGAFWVDHSYWGVEGWEVQAKPGSHDLGCFVAAPNYTTPVQIHHIVFANDIANGCQQGGFGSFDQTKTTSVDYLAIIGSIAYNAAQGTGGCASGISIYQPIQSDSLPGTHIYIAGNFSWDNFEGNPCGGGRPTDGEGIIFDTFDGSQGSLASPYAAQAVADNNVLIANGGRGFQIGNNDAGKPPFAKVYLRHNTLWGNNGDLNQDITFCGELTIYQAFKVQAYFNLAATNATNGCGDHSIFAYFVGSSNTTTDIVYQNWGYSASGSNDGIADSSGFFYLSNNTFGTKPNFTNAVVPAAPNCGNASSVPNCMATVISDFTPLNPAALRYGYQIPSSEPVYDPLFPQWLCNAGIPPGLVTMGCLNASGMQDRIRIPIR